MWRGTGAEFVQGEVRFPSGAKGIFGHLHDGDAYERYQGHEYQKMVIEELTHIPTEELYLKLMASCRSTVDGLTPQIFCTTNPGNAGHKWVKKRFVDITKHNERYSDKGGRTRIFIPAKIEDNPELMRKDPKYVAYLDSLPNALRLAWREGSWETFEVKGSYYTKWIEEARKDGRITSVPYDKSLEVHTWWDLGIGDSTVILFFQNYGHEWRLIDTFSAEGEGLAYYRSVLDEKGYLYGKHYAPHDIQVRELSTGKSRLETAKTLGIKFKVAPRLPIDDGIQAVRTRFNTLWIDQEKCEDFLEAISQYRKEFDDKRNMFKDKPLHDWTSHYADALRYWGISKHSTQGFVQFRHGY